MVVAAFPLAKIGLLLLKQLSKPVANVIKNEAKKHPYVRKYVIIPTGKAYRWVEDLTAAHVKGKTEIEPMTEEEAVELGSNAIGEIVLFGFLTAILMAEYARQGDKKAVLQKTKDEEIANLVDTVLEVIDEVDNLKKTVKQLQADLETALDVVELEEERHAFVHDHNFLDIMSGSKWIFGRKKNAGLALDMTSPSV